MTQRAHVRLVTIIVASEVQDRVKRELLGLGAGGYTVSRVDGHGLHGTSQRGVFEDGNIRFEVIVSKAMADIVLDHAAKLGESVPLIAFAHDVEAVPRANFEK
jgi:nitrogen regulatory protein PII